MSRILRHLHGGAYFSAQQPSIVALLAKAHLRKDATTQGWVCSIEWQDRPGGKLKRPWLVAPIHSPRSLALASDVARPTMRMGDSSWLLMYRILDVITCTQPHRTRFSPNTLTALCTSIQSKQHAWHGSSNECNRAGECSRDAPQWLPTLLSRPIDDTRLQYPMPGSDQLPKQAHFETNQV